jgi:hypothetical protein
MKKKVVTFGPVKVTKINKKGKGFKVLLSLEDLHGICFRQET